MITLPCHSRLLMMNRKIGSSYKIILLVVGGCLLFGLSLGIRMNFGILLNSYADKAGLPYDKISLVIAVGELVYGIMQPVFGMVAIKRSNGFVLTIGLLLLSVGFLFSACIRSVLLLVITLGIFLSAGTGAVCFGIVMGAISPFIPKNKAAAVSGVINASSGIGSSFMSPFMQNLMATLGLTKAMLILSLPALALLPVVFWISTINRRRITTHAVVSEGQATSFWQIFKSATRCRTYQYLIIGFTTCGFHMSLIQNHLYSQIISYGIAQHTAAFAYTMFGIGTIAGALFCGLICSKFSLKNVLGTLYLLRVIIIGLFSFLLPKNIISVVLFAVMLGLCGDATVTPTSEIINRKFGAVNMAFLFGIVFVCHQIGGFISTWLAGMLLNMTGSYHFIWFIDFGLCVLASVVSYFIKTKDYQMKKWEEKLF